MSDPWADFRARSAPAAAADAWAEFRRGAAIDSPDVLTDAVKSAGTGVAEGAIGIAGAGGDLRDLAARATDWTGGKLGLSPETLAAIKSGARNVVMANPVTAALAVGPTSAEVQKKVKEHTGEFYQPQTTTGEYARTVGQFLPAAVGGPGSVARRVVTQAALPGVASEAAGQATKGTQAEPYARLGAALLAGVAGVPRTAPQPVTAAELKAAAREAYNDPAVTNLVINPQGPARVATDAQRAMEAAGARRSFAPAAFDVTDELRNLPNTQVGQAMRAAGLNPGATVADVKSVGTALGKVVQGGTDAVTGALNPTAGAAVTGRKKIAEYLANLPASDVVRGDAATAGRLLKQADADYAASKRAGLVEALIKRAELQAGSSNSGQNVNNATRQKLRTLLTNEKKTAGLSSAEMEQLERAVLGTRTGNAARFVGNMFGGSGALALVPGAGAGLGASAMGADPQNAAVVAALATVLGRGARHVGNASQARQTRKFQEMIAERAPSYDTIRSAGAANAARLTAEERRIALARALIASQAAPRLNAQPQPAYQ